MQHRLSIVIPTYRREAVLTDSIAYLLAQQPAATEILVIDQTASHEPDTTARLGAWSQAGQIRWVRLSQPSITQAMNEGLRLANERIVLFLDDDIRPEPGLVAAHLAAHRAFPGALIAGRVIQPWQENGPFEPSAPCNFASTVAGEVEEFIGANFSVDKDVALDLGGFDENFVRVAYRFEAEFAHRLRSRGGRIQFDPLACLHHLKASAGGTRSFGEHLTTWRPDHAVGAYYCALRVGQWREFAQRPLRSIATRHHLRRPWHIPGTLISEIGGAILALALFARGPRLVRNPAGSDRS